MEQRDLLALIRPLRKGWPLIVIMVAGAIFLARNIYTYQLPVYESQCLIKLDDTYSGFSDNNLYQDLDIFAENNDIATEVEVLKSDTILKKALEKLNPIEYHRIGKLMNMDIYKDHPFTLSYDSLSFRDFDQLFSIDVIDEKTFRIEKGGKSLKAEFGQALVFGGNALKLELDKKWLREHGDLHLPGRYSFRLCSTEYLLQHFVKGNLLVKEVKEHVRVIRINFEGRNAERVADFTNAIAAAYLEDHIAHKMTAANLTEDFLDQRIAETSRKLNQAERALENFRLNNKVLNLAQETETELRKISQLEIQETNLNMKLVVLDSLIKYVQLDRERFLQLAPSYESYGGLLFTELVKQLKGLEEEKIELTRKYAKGSDELKAVNQKIRNLVNYIQENINNHRKNSYAQLDKIEKDIGREKKSLENIPTVEKNLKRLERDFNNFQELYNFLTKKQLEAGIAKRAQLYFHRILNKAKVASASSNPGKWFVSVLACFMALFLSIFFLYLRAFLLARIWEVELLQENFPPESPILEEAYGLGEKANFGLKLAASLKNQSEASSFIAICPSNSKLRYFHQLQDCLNALSDAGEKILCLHWEAEMRLSPSRERGWIKDYLSGEIGGNKLKSLLKGHKVLHESMEVQGGSFKLMGAEESKRFRNLSKYFDRILLILPPAGEASLLEVLKPYYDSLLCFFQKGVSRKKDLSYLRSVYSSHQLTKMAVLLNEKRASLIPINRWLKKPKEIFREFRFQQKLSPENL